MSKVPLLFLDFDGVICDSIDECIFSSVYAYFGLFLNTEIQSLPLDFKNRFTSLRPYVRNSEDYLVIQEILKEDIRIKGQDHFDGIVLKYKDKLTYYKELFYKSRNHFIESDPDFWFGLNRIYPHMLKYLSKAAASPYFYILSTKRSDFIVTILKQNRIIITDEHILVAWGKKKLDLISSLLDEKGCPEAIFVDDQIDHLLNNPDLRISPCLATWGYIRQEWLNRDVKKLDEKGMMEILAGY